MGKHFVWIAVAILAVAGQIPAANAAEADLAKICKQKVNDDTVRDYQPSLHDAALEAFKKFFPDAAEKPSDKMLAAQTKFRCMDGRVYACFIGANLPCSKMNTDKKNVGAEAFCKENPAADSVPMAATGHDTIYSYRCKGGHAEVADKLFRTDQRGFAESLWQPITVEKQAPAAAIASGDPIEARLEKCLARPDGQSSKGMARCTGEAYDAYEDKMHTVLGKVVQSVDAESAELITEAQRRWESYREAQDRADNGPWRRKGGSMTAPDVGQMRVDAIRARIEELNYYLRK